MDIFMAVYPEKFLDQIAPILTYCQQIKELMSLGANWQFYDMQFRVDREHTKCYWLTFRADLDTKALLKAFHQTGTKKPATATSASQQPFRQQSFRVPLEYCFSYQQKESRCKNQQCTYLHTCTNCGRNHPMFQPYYTKRCPYRQDHSTDSHSRYHPSNSGKRKETKKPLAWLPTPRLHK